MSKTYRRNSDDYSSAKAQREMRRDANRREKGSRRWEGNETREFNDYKYDYV